MNHDTLIGRSAVEVDAMCGHDARDPISLPAPRQSFLAAANSGWRPARVAYSPDLGITPVDPEIVSITRAAAHRLGEAGVAVEAAHPDLSEAHECFQTLRARAFAESKAGLLQSHREQLKPELIWNIEKGLRLKADDVIRAEAQRARMQRRIHAFFGRYDVLLTPATIVPPFPVSQRYVEACAGVTFSNYIEWLAIAYAISVVGCPALSMPCGFTAAGMPVGLQVVARPYADGHVLAAGRLLESVLGRVMPGPIEPRVAAQVS